MDKLLFLGCGVAFQFGNNRTPIGWTEWERFDISRIVPLVHIVKEWLLGIYAWDKLEFRFIISESSNRYCSTGLWPDMTMDGQWGTRINVCHGIGNTGIGIYLTGASWKKKSWMHNEIQKDIGFKTSRQSKFY